MQTYRSSARIVPNAADPPEVGDRPARAGVWIDRQALRDMVERSKRLAETIRARHEWIETRRRLLWARMDQR